MASILASDLISQASELAQDESNVLWTQPQALSWVNDAQRAICSIRPDASTINHSIKLVVGTKQSILGRRLISISRNMGASGLVPGKVIRLIDRKIKDEFEPNWHAATSSSEVKEYVYSIKDPKVFYVSPPVHSANDVYVEATEAINPDNIETVDDAMTIDDTYSPVIIEWVCYRFFGRDSEETPNHQRALSYLRNFYTLLGEKLPSDAAVSPSITDEE